MQDVTLRPATSENIPQLVALLEQLFSIEEDFQFSADLQQRGLNLLLSSPTSTILVAVSGNKVIGMVTGQLTISTAEGGVSLLVEDLCVEKGCRGRGIGRLLLNSIGDWACTQGAKRLQLLADRNNTKALDFYRHEGWQQTQLICLRKYHLAEEL